MSSASCYQNLIYTKYIQIFYLLAETRLFKLYSSSERVTILGRLSVQM